MISQKYSEQTKRAFDTLYMSLSGERHTHAEVVAQAEIIIPIIFHSTKEALMPEYNEILNRIIDDYEYEVGIKTYDPITIAKDKHSRYWLFNEKGNIPHPFFDRYKLYLRSDGFGWKDIENIEKTCEETLAYCANPKNPSGYDKKKGLVVGDVQSGKTANYLGLINMAFDYGYRIVVLLAGTTNSLRLQTQKRTDAGVIGAKSDSIGNEIEYIGVGLNTHDHFAVPFTNQTNDFARFIQKNINAQIGDFNKPVVLVVKKVKSILESVSNRLQSELSNKGLDSKSILIIDDEADNASINTAREGNDPTSINKCIRAIFNKFSIASYVGYTATPFANIFIKPHDEKDNLDLFPSDFIELLTPPDKYFGGRVVFPQNDELPNCISVISELEDDFLPVVHDRTTYYPALANSLKCAIQEFLLNNVIRTLRGHGAKHRSMMINITRFNDVQKQIEERVLEYKENLEAALLECGQKSIEEFCKNKYCVGIFDIFNSAQYEEVRKGNKEGKTQPISWEEIQTGLYDEIKKFVVTVINSKNGKMTRRSSEGNERFDYETFKETGARVIAIGGMVLSRGLTLEGLMTSYYSRNAATYDTLLQMCRWFGYRPGYQDLCRVYLTQDNIDKFKAVLDAVEDLKSQFVEMKRQDKKPSEFGLLVRESPDTLDTTMLITARNKLRGTEEIPYYLSYGGVYSDTSKLLPDKQININNLKCTNSFLSKLNFSDGLYATNVSKYEVSEFIASLNIPYVNKKFDTDGLSEYIANSDIFLYWDVVVASGDGRLDVSKLNLSQKFNGQRCSERRFHVNNADDLYIRIGGHNNRVMEPSIFGTGVIPEKINFKKSEKNGADLSVKDYLSIRTNPLLVIYPIALKSEVWDKECEINGVPNEDLREKIKSVKESFIKQVGNEDTPLMAFAFGFPTKESPVKFVYRANLVKLEELKNVETSDDEEGIEDNE